MLMLMLMLNIVTLWHLLRFYTYIASKILKMVGYYFCLKGEREGCQIINIILIVVALWHYLIYIYSSEDFLMWYNKFKLRAYEFQNEECYS